MQPQPLDQLGPTQRSKIVTFLQEHPVGVLATVDSNGDPYATTLYFDVDSRMRVTFTTKQDTYKYKNIVKHGTVMLVVHEASKQIAVQIRGKAVELKDPAVQQAVYHATLRAAQKTGEDVVPPIAKIAAGPYAAFAIEVETVRLTEYGWGNNFTNATQHVHDRPSGGDPA
jgi:uncharacterized pyridoxamine 5'-phosphate oxidase family protein